MAIVRRRALLKAAAAAPALYLGRRAQAALTGFVGSASGATKLATLTLNNTSGSAQAANFTTPMFGHVFKEGDIPSGTAPTFKVGSTVQPYSWGMQAYWGDGSLKFASFMVLCKSSIAGNGTLGLDIYNGGTAPTTSARTLTEVYAQSLSISGVGQGTNFGLNGTWTANLANDAFNHEQFVYLDGDAGKVWRILTDFVQSAAAHGQLECYHYVAALTDSAGALGGFRHLGRVCQPWWDVNSPAKSTRAFSSLAYAGPLSTTVVFETGAGQRFEPLAFTCTNNVTTMSTTGANSYYQGATGYQNIPVYLTGLSGATGLSATTQYFMGVNSNGTFVLSTESQVKDSEFTPTANGGGTVNPVLACVHFNQIVTAQNAADGTGPKWVFFQGSGSMTAEATVRTTFDTTYWRSTKMLPPFDASVTPTGDNSFAYDWFPFSIGPLVQFMGQAGGRSDIGPVTDYHAIHWYKQTAASEKMIRMIGYCSGAQSFCFKDSTSKQLVNFSNSDYTGMALHSATQQGLLWNDGRSGASFTVPPHTSTFPMYENDDSHKPQFSYYTYLVTGEPQFLDFLLEEANGSILMQLPNNRNTTTPYTAYGLWSAYPDGGQLRALAWSCRQINLGAGICPNPHPDGSQLWNYFDAQATAGNKWVIDIDATPSTTALLAAPPTGQGLSLPIAGDGTNLTIFGEPNWYFFVAQAMCYAAAIRGDTYATTYLNTLVNTWTNYIRTTYGMYHLYSFIWGTLDGDCDVNNNNQGYPSINASNRFGVQMQFEMSWDGSTPHFFFSTTDLAGVGWTLTGGASTPDTIIFKTLVHNGPAPPGAGFTVGQPYFVINPNNGTGRFDLSATKNGSAIAPTGTGTTNQNWVVTLGVPPTSGVTCDNASDGPLGGGWCAFHWIKAILGGTDFDALITDVENRFTTHYGYSMNDQPRFGTQASF